MTAHDGENWPYHEDPNGNMVPCESNPCSLHGGNDVIATNPAEAFSIKHENDSYGLAVNNADSASNISTTTSTGSNENDKIISANSASYDDEIRGLLAVNHITPELAYANSNLNTETKLELVKPGDKVIIDGEDGVIIPSGIDGEHKVMRIDDCSTFDINDVRDRITNVKLEDAATADNVLNNTDAAKQSAIIASGVINPMRDSVDADGRLSKTCLDIFDYPKNSPYSVKIKCSNGDEYTIRRLNYWNDNDYHEKFPDGDNYHYNRYELAPANKKASEKYGSGTIYMDEDYLRKSIIKNDYVNYELRSNEKSSDYSLSSRYKKIQQENANYIKLNNKLTNISNVLHNEVKKNGIASPESLAKINEIIDPSKSNELANPDYWRKKQQSDYQDGVNEYKRMSLHNRATAVLQGYTAKVYGNDKRIARNRETTGTIDMNVFSLKKELQDKINRFPKNTRIIPDANDVNKWMHSEFIKLYKNK